MKNKRLLKLKSFDIKGLEYKNNDLFIHDAVLDDFYTVFKIDREKNTNIDGLMVKKAEKKTRVLKKRGRKKRRRKKNPLNTI